MKKLSKLFILTIFLSIFISSPVFAAVPTPTVKNDTSTNITLSNVNIRSARIFSQEGNTFGISFAIVNGEGVQNGIRYSVSLAEEKNGNLSILDEKKYDESLTLYSNTTVRRDVYFTPYSSLTGSHYIYLNVTNSSGFPFSIYRLDKVTLKGQNSGLQILSETCSLKIFGDKTNKSHSIVGGISIKQGENLKLTCTGINSTKEDLTLTPYYEVRSDSAFGDLISQKGGDFSPISFKSGEKKSFTVDLPKAEISQSYNLNFSLKNDKINSNTINTNYTVMGNFVKIENISLDKDYYKKGSTALVSAIFRSQGFSSLSSNIKITNGKGKPCSTPLSSSISNSFKLDSSISITKECLNPIVFVSVLDDKGTLLDQKELKIKTTSYNPKVFYKTNIFNIVLTLLSIILIFCMKRKKCSACNSKNNEDLKKVTNSISLKILFPFLILISLMFMPTGIARASNQTSSDGNANTTYFTDSTSYITGANITTSGVIGLNVMDRALVTNMYITNTVNGQTVQSAMLDGNTTNPMFIIIPTPSSTNRTAPSGNTTFTAQSTSGNYYGTVTISYYYNGVPHSYAFTSNYSVSYPGAASVTVFINGVASSNTSVSYSSRTNTSIISWTSLYATGCSCNLTGLGFMMGIGACNPSSGNTFGSRIVANSSHTFANSETVSVVCY